MVVPEKGYGLAWTERNYSGYWTGIAISSDGQKQTAVVYEGYYDEELEEMFPIGKIYTSSNYGSSWTERDYTKFWKEVAMSSNGQYQTATCEDTYIYRSSDYGVTWAAVAISEWFQSVDLSSSGQYQTGVVGYGGNIYTSSDYGASWTQRSETGSCSDIALSSSGQYQLTGKCDEINGYIYVSSDYGFTWTSKTSPGLGCWITGSMSSDGQYQIMADLGGEIYTSDDYGATWTQVVSAPAKDWFKTDMSSSGQYQTILELPLEDPGKIYTSP